MFCVIQEIERKKPNTYGAYKEFKVSSTTFTVNGITKTKYYYEHTGERFERPIKKAYKVSIHESKRINGVVTKKQYVVTTVDYYSLAEYWIGDCMADWKLKEVAEALNTTIDKLKDLIYSKVYPLEERIQAEFKKTAEYKAQIKHGKIIEKYRSKKEAFAKAYSVSEDEYDYCYDVFGNVMNQEYLDKIIEADKQRQESYSSYSKQSSSNYNYSSGSYDYSSYFGKISSTYNDDEKAYLKKFYKALSMKFHPDMNAGHDTTKEMQLLNKLKENWGL